MSENKKPKRVFLQVDVNTTQERERIKDQAKSLGLNTSQYIRGLIIADMTKDNVNNDDSKKLNDILNTLLKERDLREQERNTQQKLIEIVQKQFSIVQRINGNTPKPTDKDLEKVISLLTSHRNTIPYKLNGSVLTIDKIMRGTNLDDSQVIRILENNRNIKFIQKGKGWDIKDVE